MGLFGKSKEDTSQDTSIQQLQKDISNCWAWIQQLNKNQVVLIKNNNSFLQKNKNQTTLNQQLIDSVNGLVEKDKLHDQKDAEHDALIQGFKAMAKNIEATE